MVGVAPRIRSTRQITVLPRQYNCRAVIVRGARGYACAVYSAARIAKAYRDRVQHGRASASNR